MDKKPKIAFCFSGQARTLDWTYMLFKRNLFDAAIEQGFDYDVFCAVEDDEDVDKIKLLNPTSVDKSKYDDVKKIIDNKYGEKWQKTFLSKYRWIGCPVEQFLQQLYKVSKSFCLKNDYQIQNNIKYDLVFKLRFDTAFINKLNYNTILHNVEMHKIITQSYIEKNKISQYIFNKLWGIRDYFFIGVGESLNSLSCIFDSFEDGFKGNELKTYNLGIIFRLISSLFKFINNTIGKWILPVLPFYFFESLFYKIFTPEGFYYHYLEKNNNIIKDKFSLIKLTKNIKDSKTRFYCKNNIEL